MYTELYSHANHRATRHCSKYEGKAKISLTKCRQQAGCHPQNPFIRGMEPKRHDVTQHPTCLKPPDHIAEDSDEAGEVWQGSAPAMFGWLKSGVRMGYTEVLNPIVEAKCKANRPP
jgi:hypothetical protein